MIQKVQDRMTPKVLQAITQGLGLSPEGLEAQDGFCSFVHLAKLDGQDVVLKISPSERLERRTLEDELRLVQIAVANGALCCAPRTAPSQIFEQRDESGGSFLAYLYEFVPGENADEVAPSAKLWRATGAALGSFHRALKGNDFKGFSGRRDFLDQTWVDFDRILPPDEVDTRECFGKIFDQLNQLDRDSDNFGFTHGDSHPGNFLFDGQTASLIDFDELERGFFLNDIASLLEGFCDTDENRNSAQVERVFRAFLEGYRKFVDPRTLAWKNLEVFFRFSWISDHCLKQILSDSRPREDFQRRRELRRELFRSHFAEYDFLYRFDFDRVVQAIASSS